MTTISSQTVAATKTLDDTQVLILEVTSEELKIPLDGSDLIFIPKGRGNNPQRGKTQQGEATKSKDSSYFSTSRNDSSTKHGSPIKSSGTSSKDKDKNKTKSRS